MLQLSRNLASEWGQYGIRVNTISPGYIVTEMVEALFVQYPERRTDWPTQNMLGRLSKPEEYRGAAAFLISDASSFMTGKRSFAADSRVFGDWLADIHMRTTGSDLRIDGGHSAW